MVATQHSTIEFREMAKARAESVGARREQNGIKMTPADGT